MDGGTKARVGSFPVQRLGVVLVIIVAVATMALVAKNLFTSNRAGKMVELIDTVSKGMAVYSGTSGGQIPDGRDLLAELRRRKLVVPKFEPLVPGHDIASVTRLGPLRYRIAVSCPKTKSGNESCGSILDANDPDQHRDVLAVDGRGTNQVTITMRL